MASHVSDTWQAMCHNAWQRHACVTHGMPCVNMHDSFEAYIRGSTWAVLTSKGGAASFCLWEQQGEGGGREKEKGRKGEEKGRKGKEKGKKKREEERGGREEKERGKGRSVMQ